MNRLTDRHAYAHRLRFYTSWVWVITDDDRLERGEEQRRLLRNGQETGFDPVASCTPSTCSAWLSYILIKNG